MQRKNSQSGFTLIELSIGLLLTGLIMAGLFSLLSTSLESRTRSGRNTELQQSVRYALDLMVRELQYATTITAVNPESITFTTDQFGAGTITYSLDRSGATGILRRNQNDGSGNQPVTGEGQTVNVSINALEFRTLMNNSAGQPLTVGIEITATDLAVNAAANRPRFTLRTAVTGMNIPR